MIKTKQKPLSLKATLERNIIILLGYGKSTLTQFLNPDAPLFLGVHSLKKGADKIKLHCKKNYPIIIHLDNEKELDQLPAGIKRRALIYYISF